jgi:hypothetical protein
MRIDYEEGFKDGLRQAMVLVLNHGDAPVTAIKAALDLTCAALEKRKEAQAEPEQSALAPEVKP